jgi:hypothetical protein
MKHNEKRITAKICRQREIDTKPKKHEAMMKKD